MPIQQSGSGRIYRKTGNGKIMSSNWCTPSSPVDNPNGNAPADIDTLQTDITGMVRRWHYYSGAVRPCYDCEHQTWPAGYPVYTLNFVGNKPANVWRWEYTNTTAPYFLIKLTYVNTPHNWHVLQFWCAKSFGFVSYQMGIWIKVGSTVGTPTPVGVYRVACGHLNCDVCLETLVVSES